MVKILLNLGGHPRSSSDSCHQIRINAKHVKTVVEEKQKQLARQVHFVVPLVAHKLKQWPHTHVEKQKNREERQQ